MAKYLSMSLEEKNELNNFRVQFPQYFMGDEDELLGNNRPEKAIKSIKSVRFARKQRYVSLLLKIFEFYIENRKEEVFGPKYISFDKKLKDKFGEIARALYRNSDTSLKEDGGFSEILKLAIEVNPKIEDYLKKEDLTLNHKVSQLLEVFDFFLMNRGIKEVFSTNYIENDSKVKGKFGKNFGHNLRVYANRFGSMSELIQIAAKERPEMLRYWGYR